MSGDHRHYSNLMAIAPNVSIVVFVPQSRLIRQHSIPQPRVECLVWLDCAAAAPMILEINNWYWAVLRRTFHSRDPYPFQPVHLSPRHHKPDSSLSSTSIQQRPLSVCFRDVNEPSRGFTVILCGETSGRSVALTAEHHTISPMTCPHCSKHMFYTF